MSNEFYELFLDKKYMFYTCADFPTGRETIEEAQTIKERFGLDVGGIPPFGTLLQLDTYFDEEISLHPQSAFNCGLPTESIIMRSSDLLSLVQPKLGRFSK